MALEDSFHDDLSSEVAEIFKLESKRYEAKKKFDDAVTKLFEIDTKIDEAYLAYAESLQTENKRLRNENAQNSLTLRVLKEEIRKIVEEKETEKSLVKFEAAPIVVLDQVAREIIDVSTTSYFSGARSKAVNLARNLALDAIAYVSLNIILPAAMLFRNAKDSFLGKKDYRKRY